MNRFLSEKFIFISFVSMILVVFLHSYGTDVSIELKYGQFDFNVIISVVQLFISQVVARVSVPIFFFISGYLFFLNKKFSLNIFFAKLKKRIHSVLVPYLLWSIYGLILFYVLQSVPFTKIFFSGDLLNNYSTEEVVNKLFLKPIPYQLWFLRDLFVLFIISPMIYFFTKKTRGLWLAFLLILWSINCSIPNFVRLESLLFFSFGCYFALYFQEWLVKKYDRNYPIIKILPLIWVVLSVTVAYLMSWEENKPIWNILLYKINIILGIFSIWFIYDFLYSKNVIRVYPVCYSSFFIYAFHEPLLTIIKKGLMSLFEANSFVKFLIYCLSPIITIIISVFVSFLLKRYFFRFYNIVTGGR